MYNKIHKLTLILGSIFLSACAGNHEIQTGNHVIVKAPISLTAHTKEVRVTKELSLKNYDDIRIGAAINQGGYKHVLAQNQNNYDSNEDNIDINETIFWKSQIEDGIGAINNELNINNNSINTFNNKKLNKKTEDILNSNTTKIYPKFTAHDKPYEAVFMFLSSNSHIEDYSMYELGRWERFCDFGKNMDKLDWKFVKANKTKFPAELKETCTPPSYRALVVNNFFRKD